MNRFISTLLISVLLMVSCSKNFEAEIEIEESTAADRINFSITASIEDVTTSKATSDPVIRVTWNANDRISVLDLTNGVNLGVIIAESTGSDVNFSGNISKPNYASCIGYVYPAIEAAPSGTVATGVAFATQNINDRTIFCASAVDSDPGASLGNKKIKFSIANAFIDVGMTDLPASTSIGKFKITDVNSNMSWEFSTTGINALSDGNGEISLTPATTAQTSNKGYFMFGFACPPSPEKEISRLIKIYDNNLKLVCHADIFQREIVNNEFIETVTTGHGLFSVAADRYVYFSPGNLQAIVNESGVATSWNFATNQYTHIGSTDDANQNAINGPIDLFSWSTDGQGATGGYKILGINTSHTETDYNGNFSDWGFASSVTSSIGTGWRTLTKDEWSYLLNNDSPGRKRKLNVDVCGTKCIVLAPDRYAQDIPSSYTTENWPAAEKEGFICLPITEYRNNTESGPSISGSEYGHYWSSATSQQAKPYLLSFTTQIDQAPEITEVSRKDGYAVRLVRD